MKTANPNAVETVLMSVRPHAAVLGIEEPVPGQPTTGPQPAQRELLAPRPEDRIVSLYQVSAGAAHVRLARGEVVPLEPGQLLVTLGESPTAVHAGPRPEVVSGCTLVAAHYAIDRLLSRSWSDGASDFLVVKVPRSSEWMTEALSGAARQAGRPGSQALAARIAEAALCEAVRLHLVEREGPLPVPVAADRIVTRCLSLMHKHLASPWTVERLAAESGASRSILAERFTRHIGASPMAYLQKIRLQWASQCLRSTSLSVSHVASAAGYGTDAAFNRAFRREYGHPPGVWRRLRGAAV
jgi:AraC-like DNA-binding protein